MNDFNMKRRTETMDFRHYRPNFEKCYNDHHQQTIMSSKLCSKQNFSHKSITKCLLIILFTATITLIEAVIEERGKLNKNYLSLFLYLLISHHPKIKYFHFNLVKILSTNFEFKCVKLMLFISVKNNLVLFCFCLS